jgi:CheY-like chemotaxis protein
MTITIRINSPHSTPIAFLPRPSSLDPENADLELSSPQLEERQKRVLVIDDEPAIADSLVEILNVSGYDAIAFYSGHDAIEFARQRCPDLVISDVVMPKLNGVDTVLSIRELCPATRVFLFSGQASTVDILKRARAKGHEFELIAKPIHPEALLKILGS